MGSDCLADPRLRFHMLVMAGSRIGKEKIIMKIQHGTLLLNGYSIYWLCLTFWTNEFLGSYCNYKSLISISIFSRISLWRTLCLQSNIEEVLYLSFSTSISSSRFSFPSPFLPSFSIFIQSFEEFNK